MMRVRMGEKQRGILEAINQTVFSLPPLCPILLVLCPVLFFKRWTPVDCTI